MKRNAIKPVRPAVLAAVAVASLAAVTLAGCQTGTTGPGAAGTGTTARQPAATPNPAATSNPMYRYYRSMMGRYQGGMMGGAPGWMMGAAGYRWMIGAGGVPAWMHGRRLPGSMMGGLSGMGKFMGRFWAGAPGPRVSPAQAARLGNQVPAGARLDRSARVITFTSTDVRFAVEASPPGGPDETFRIAGLTNPKLVVPAGARVRIEVINADPGMAHGLVVTGGRAPRSWMPMMTARPAFAGSALWFLGNPTSAGLHAATVTFRAATPGSYWYLCAVPGHAREGMIGRFIVTGPR